MRFASPAIDLAAPPIPNDFSAYHCLAAQPNGDVVIASYWMSDAEAPLASGGVARVHARGAIDGHFGNVGVNKVLVMGQTHFNAIALQPDGKIVVAGGDGSADTLAAARYLGK